MGWGGMAERMLGVVVKTFSEPAGSVVWLPGGQEPGVTLPHAVFDAAHTEVDPDTGGRISTDQPLLGVRISDLPAPPTTDDRVRVGEQLYEIVDVHPDGIAGALLVLKRRRS